MKRFLTLYLPPLLLVGGLTAYLGVNLSQSRQATFEAGEATQLHSSAQLFSQDLERPLEQLQGLAQEPALQRAFVAPPAMARRLMQDSLQSLLFRNPRYLQARWLGADGMEQVRVDRVGDTPQLVDSSQLQDKSDRPYFIDTIRLPPGQLYLSTLDLNIEHGQVAVPYQPVIRALIRLPRVQGCDQGMLVINILAQHLIDEYVANNPSARGEQLMLLNSQGGWLVAPDPQDAWSHQLGRDGTLARREPQAWARIAAAPSGRMLDESGLWVWNSIDPATLFPGRLQAADRWKLVSHLDRNQLEQLWWQGWPLLLLSGGVVLLLLVFAVRRYSQLLSAHDAAAAELAAARQLEQSQAELQKSHDLLSLTEQAAGVGFWDWDLSLGPDRLNWSDQMFRLFGLEPASVSANFETWRQAVHPDDLPAAEAAIAEALREHRPFAATYRVIWPDGSVHWIDAFGHDSRDAAGTPRHFSGLCLDVTARKQSEQILRDLNASLESKVRERTAEIQLLAENASDVVFRGNNSGMLEWISPSVTALVGWLPEQMIGRPFLEFIHPDDLATVSAAQQRLLQGERTTFETRIRTRDGGWRWVSIGAKAILSAAGQVEARVGGWRDIQSEVTVRNQLSQSRQQIEQALAEMTASETRFHAIFAQAPIGIALTGSRSGHIYECNARYAAIAGRSIEELRRGNWMHVTHPDDIQPDLDNMALLNAGEIPGFQMNKRYLRPDGSVVWVRMTVARIQVDPHESPRHLCMVEDITEQRQIEQSLLAAKDAAEQASRAKSAFVANMSHEVRTPMNAVLGFLDILADSGLDAQQRTLVDKVQKSSRSLLRILNDILDFSKLDAGAVDLELAPFVLDEVLRDATDLFVLAASAKGLELVLDVPPGLPPRYSGDALRLGQILVNLLGNAIKFTERGSVHLAVTVLADEGTQQRLRFEVKDSGIGLTPEQTQLLFQPFVQADSSTTRRFGGTGLGLTIAKRLVELMGGAIGVRSELGRGTTFWFTVLLTPDRRVESGAPPQLTLQLTPERVPAVEGRALDHFQQAMPIRGAELLLVEDNSTNQEVALAMLTKMGLQVTVANDGREATAAIRASRWGHSLPIIAMTASAFDDDRRRVLDAGMNDFVSKPVDPQQLLRTLLRWLPQPQPTAETAADACPAKAAVLPPSMAPQGMFVADLDGFDLARTLDRLGQDQPLLLRVLRQFLCDFKPDEWVGQFDAACLDGERAHAQRLVHTLLGVASNVGAVRLQAAAAALNAALKDEACDPAKRQQYRNDCLDALRAAVAAVQASLPVTNAEIQAAQQDLAAVEQLLCRNRLVPMTLLTSLQEHMGQHQAAMLLETLHEQIGVFDFDRALKTLKAMQDSLSS